VSIPVIAVGRIVEPEQAEQVLASGQADMVALGRALIADPAWANNALAGRIIPCIGCNACNARSRRPQIVCVNNPATGREAEFPDVPAPERKRVLVLGGGLAALVAADYAARRGHEVQLWPAAPGVAPLGGLLELRSRVPGMAELHKSLEYFGSELVSKGIPVGEIPCDGTLVEQARAFAPDLVVAAERGAPKLPRVEGAEPGDFTPAGSVLAGYTVPRRAVIIGGNLMGADTALYLAERGSRVWLVEEGAEVALNAHPSVRYWHLQALRKSEVTFLPNTRVVRKEGGTVYLHNVEGEIRLDDVDALVVSLGFEPWDVPALLAEAGLPVEDIGDTYDASDLSELTYRAARVVYDL
jgi:NADPH-dependent 2,4-dienoyl-CoA reductase/sulfur reductase-like enzyme